MQTREKESRDSGIIIILILLLGFVCIILASGWALRFAPSWKLNTNMGSSLNPNSDFLTSRPVNFIEPIDPAILTQPAWINVFLTPGISLATRTPLPPTHIATNIPPKTSTPLVIPTQITIPTNTLVVVVVVPTNTKKNPPPPPPPSTNTSVPPPLPTSTNTPVPPPSADLQITNTDNATNYDANVSVQYIIVVSNPSGPNAVTGATVTDTFSANLMNITWTCAGVGGASCTASGTVTINDSSVNLPVGTSVTYTVNATVIGTPSGSLVNTATVSAGITDPTPGNNSATDTDQLIAASTFPPSLTTSGDGNILNMSTGSFLDLQLATPLTLGATSKVIYYPDPTAPTLQMDVVILQIGDGKNWYTILNWGDGAPNANTDTPAIPACAVSETDNCVIDATLLTNSPGITINLSGLIPPGTYPYIRIKSPGNPPDTGDGVSIDAIVVVP